MRVKAPTRQVIDYEDWVLQILRRPARIVPSYAEMAREMGCSVSYVHKIVQRLLEAKRVDVVRDDVGRMISRTLKVRR